MPHGIERKSATERGRPILVLGLLSRFIGKPTTTPFPKASDPGRSASLSRGFRPVPDDYGVQSQIRAESSSRNGRSGVSRWLAASACLAVLAYGPIVSAQIPSAQRALRDRWRFSVEFGALIYQTDRFSSPTLVANSISGTVSASFAAWRAVTSWLDLGGRAGLWLPDIRYRRFHPGSSDCPGGESLTMTSADAVAPGVSAFVMPGLRLRLFGSSVPFHVNAGVALSAWGSLAGMDAQWRCQTGPVHTQYVPPEGVFATAIVLGVSSHFGASEQFSIGIDYWGNIGAGPAQQRVGAMTFGWEFNAGPALPAEVRGRGTVATVLIAITGSVAVLFILGLQNSHWN